MKQTSLQQMGIPMKTTNFLRHALLFKYSEYSSRSDKIQRKFEVYSTAGATKKDHAPHPGIWDSTANPWWLHHF